MTRQGLPAPTTERPSNTAPVVRRLLAYFKPYWKSLIGVLLMLILTAVAQAGGPALIGRAVDEFISVGNASGLAQTMLLLLGVYVIGFIGTTGQSWLMGRVSQGMLKQLRLDIFNHLQRLSLGYYSKQEAGDLMSRLVNDTEIIGNLFSQAFVQTLSLVFGLIGIIIAMFLLNWQLAIATLLIVPLMIAVTVFFGRRSRVAYRVTRETIGDVSAYVQEDISSIREAQAFNRTEHNIIRFEEANALNRNANVSAAGITAAFAPAIDVLSAVATALVAGLGGWLAFNGSITVGVVVAFLSYVDRFFRPVQQMSQACE